MSIALSQATAVRDVLAGGPFTPPLSPVVRFLPRRAGDATDTMSVDVIPAPQSRESDTRAGPYTVQNVAVVVDRKVDVTGIDADPAQTDEVVTLAEAIVAFLSPNQRRALTIDGITSQVLSVSIGDGVNLLDIELLDSLQLARCVVTVQLRIL